MLPASAAMSNGTTAPWRIVVAPTSPSSGEACAALFGAAVVLTSIYAARGAHDPVSRLNIIADRNFAQCLERHLATRSLTAFDGAFLGLHPFWLAAAVTALDSGALSDTKPWPASIAGFALAETLVGAIHLASNAGPFDVLVPALRRIMKEVAGDGGQYSS